MSSFFEFLIKAILCMRVKNFTTVHLIARGLQLTLFHYGVNIAAMQKGSTPSLAPKILLEQEWIRFQEESLTEGKQSQI